MLKPFKSESTISLLNYADDKKTTNLLKTENP